MDFSYLPLGWTCQSLANNAAGQNLGYDMHAPTMPGHPSVRPVTGEAAHMMAGAPTTSAGGPISNDQMRLHTDASKKTYADGVPALSEHPEHDIASSKKEIGLLTGVDHGAVVGTHVSTPQTRDGRYDPPAPFPYDRASGKGEDQFATAQERAGESAMETDKKAQDKAVNQPKAAK